MPNNCTSLARLLLLIISAFLLSSVFSRKLYAGSAFDPLEYPFGVIGNQNPPFIWQDIYNERDMRYKAKYRITLKKKAESAKAESYIVSPVRYQVSFYVASLPNVLLPGSYGYTVERLVDNIAVDSKYYHYRRYPITGEFVLDPGKRLDFEKLSNEKLVDYLMLERKNRRENGYHALFFVGSATFSLGAGYAAYRYTDFGIITTVIVAVCVLSSAVGYGAGTYYGYRYYEGMAALEKMIPKQETENISQKLTEKTTWFSVGRLL